MALQSATQSGARAEGFRSVWRLASRWAPVAVLVAGVVVFFAFDLDRYITFESLRRHRFQLLDFVAAHRALALLAFVSLYAAAVAMSLPGAVWLTLMGGFLFGVVESSLAVIVGATLGATLIFAIAKTALGDPLRARALPWMQKLEHGFAENAFIYLLVLRLIPLFPFFAVNLVPAFLGVPLRIYVLATMIGIVPGVIVYSTVGSGLGAIFDSGEEFSASSVLQPEVVGGLIGLAVLVLLPVAYKKLRRRRG